LSLGASYGVLAAATLYLVAPALPVILGDEYRQAVAAVRWLAILPLLKALHYFGADALTGAGYQGVRTMLLVGIAVVNILLNAWLIPLYSWRGAAVATIVSDALLGAAIWAAVWYLGRHGQRAQTGENTPAALEVG
jgi:O-antigen/teichoic acid export membrane protein